MPRSIHTVTVASMQSAIVFGSQLSSTESPGTPDAHNAVNSLSLKLPDKTNAAPTAESER